MWLSAIYKSKPQMGEVQEGPYRPLLPGFGVSPTFPLNPSPPQAGVEGTARYDYYG
ncbi:hypothetical protein KDA_15490 [Dictyobacter alpinus]|uniref:Uncharacterized protein n=1 Tax=Dictyobacter alpinus TaxID=2014873 RepID=A0A402B3Y7_9CHLR|nr:hypothetical protein KDA_15490 [Dictyobacter alpinus]